MEYPSISKASTGDDVLDEYSSGYTQGYYSGDEQKKDSQGNRVNPTTQNRGDITTTGGTLSPKGQTTVQRTTYSGKAPKIPELETFVAPEGWTDQQRAEEVQKQAGLGLREARLALRETINGLQNDPASKLARARALQAHGVNVERAISTARRASTDIENIEEAKDLQEATINYQAYLNNRNAIIQQAWNAWLSTGVTISTSKYLYDSGEGEEITPKTLSVGGGGISLQGY